MEDSLWIEAIATTLVVKAPKSWTDDDRVRFDIGLSRCRETSDIWSVAVQRAEAAGNRPAALYNTLNAMHELLVYLVLMHRRHFATRFVVAPMMNSAINDFPSTWTISIGSFDGLLTKSAPGSRGRAVFYG